MSTAYLQPGDRIWLAVPVSPTATLEAAQTEARLQAQGMGASFAEHGVTVAGWSSHGALSHPVVVAVFRTPAAAIADEQIERGNDETMKAYSQLRALRGRVVTLLGLCDGLQRVPGYDPMAASVAVHEIRRIFEGSDRGGDVPVESAPAAEDEPRSPHRCPDCDEPTEYQRFSGGREFYCRPCDNHGMYPEGAAPPRLQMLADGKFDELRQEMRAEIVKRKAGGAASVASADTTKEIDHD